MRLLVVILSCLALGGTCDTQQPPLPPSAPSDVVTRAEFDALKTELAAVKAERDAAKQQAQTAIRDVTVKLPQYPLELPGVLRPAGSLGPSVSWDELCFDPQAFQRWHAPLVQALTPPEQRRQRRMP